MWLVQASLKNPYAVTVAALALMVAGAVSLLYIPADILPVFKSPGVLVMTFYSGMPANAIERTITSRMERWCSQATGVNHIESKSMVGVSIVRIYFRDDIDPAAALTEVNSLALSTLPFLPPGTLPPVVRPFDPTATLPLAILSVSSPKGLLEETQLQDYARIELRNQLSGLPGVIAPTVFGGRERNIMVYVRPDDMEARQIAPLDVVHALHRFNDMLPAGTAKMGDEEVQLDSNAMVKEIKELNDFPVKVEGDRVVYLRDVGEAKDASSIQTSLVRIDGKPQVYVPVYRMQGASSLAVVNAVQHELPLMKSRAPEGTQLDVVMDQSIYVREAIRALIDEGVLGAILAALMILIFLGSIRLTAIAALTIPISVLAAIAALQATGQTINAMTLGGLALAVGPLVDNAIMTLENVHRHMSMGKSALKAALDGTVEIAQPAMVSTTSTIIVLVPLAFMPGMGRFLFRPLALAMGFAMLASLFLALTFVPVRCAAWLGGHGHGHGEPRPRSGLYGWGMRFNLGVDRALHGLTRRYEHWLLGALRYRGLILGFAFFLFVASCLLVLKIGREFFPQVDSGQLTVFVRYPTGTKIEKTNERMAKFEKFVREVIPPGDLHMIVSELGVTTNWSAAYTPNSGPQDAVVKIQLTDDRSKTSQEFATELRHEFHARQAADRDFADMRISFDTGGMVSSALNYGATSPIEIQVIGGSQQAAYRMARTIRDEIERAKGAKGAADVHIHQRIDYPQMLIEIDRSKAELLGLGVRDVFQTVTTVLNSSIQVDRNFWIDLQSGNQYFIAVQYAEKADFQLDEVKNIPITGPRSGEVVKLGTLVKFRRLDDGPAEVVHDNLSPVYSIMVNTEGRDIGSLADSIGKKIKKLELPRGMIVAMKGEYERMNEAFGNLGFGLFLASILVYLLMVAQFRSYVSPLIIMFTVPLGLIGVLWTLYLTNTTLNVQSCMGVIFMVGIVVSQSTLVVDFANKQRDQGANVREAIVTASTLRLRAVLMTFLATFLDLLPIAIGVGKGSEANIPLGRAVVGGLLCSKFLSLFIVPIMYTLFNRDPVPAGHATVTTNGEEEKEAAVGVVGVS